MPAEEVNSIRSQAHVLLSDAVSHRTSSSVLLETHQLLSLLWAFPPHVRFLAIPNMGECSCVTVAVELSLQWCPCQGKGSCLFSLLIFNTLHS